ncbi:hypothetical protein [Massilia sp. TWP1-3-3]|uniref:hypothetical protein n=1 Tax=Massilia sp. TWP1-3-3 TaxID=2804573 RepID=UPI003CF194F3
MNNGKEIISSGLARRQVVLKLVSLSLLHPLLACGKSRKAMQKEMRFDVVLYNFFNSHIIDIHLNDSDIGIASRHGSTSVVSGVVVPMGLQKLSWRVDGRAGAPRNGETVVIKNKVVLQASDVPANTRYMGVHLYPDETAEFTFSQYIPEVSARGEAILKESEKHGR